MKHLSLSDFDAVAFDFEGTLADTIPTHHATRMKAFEHHGFGHITSEQHALGPTYGSVPADIIGGILHAAGEITKDGPFKHHPTVQNVIATKAKLFDDVAASGFTEMPGAAAFVKTIAEKFPNKIAIVTTLPERFVTPFLERYGLMAHFSPDQIIGEKTVQAEGLEPKPAPDAFELAMQRLNAKRLLVFEDTAPGVESAKRAGATVVALGFDKHNAELFASGKLAYPPDVFVTDYGQARKASSLA